MQEVSSFSSVGFRLLYSPLSNILSLHYFTVNPYSLTEYKKAQNDVSNYTEGQTLSTPDPRPTPGGGVFLQRMKAACEGSRDFSHIEIENNISFRFQPQVFRMVPERPNTEDVIINRLVGKRLSRDEEFLFDYEKQERTTEVKRRLLEKHMPNGDLSFDIIP